MQIPSGVSQISKFVTQIAPGVASAGMAEMPVGTGMPQKGMSAAQNPAFVHAECSFALQP
jgi:hypothetical protein